MTCSVDMDRRIRQTNPNNHMMMKHPSHHFDNAAVKRTYNTVSHSVLTSYYLSSFKVILNTFRGLGSVIGVQIRALDLGSPGPNSGQVSCPVVEIACSL